MAQELGRAFTIEQQLNACPPMPWPAAGFSRLTSLRIARRSFLTDHQLFPVLSAAPGLRELALASCPALSDATLAAAPPGLMSLQLVCCERITGAFGWVVWGGGVWGGGLGSWVVGPVCTK